MSIYLKIPSISGSVNTKNYQGCIEVFNYQFSGERPLSQKAGVLQNRSSGFVEYSRLTFSKVNDKSTIDLLEHFYKAKVIPEITFSHVTTGEQPKCYMANTFHDVLISRITEVNDVEHVIEEITLHFSRYDKRNMPLDQNHKLTSPKNIGYDLQKSYMV